MPNIKYNFDKGYNNLSKISVPIRVFDYNLRPFLDNVILSAYADFTPIQVTPDFFNAEDSVSDNNYFIDFGDGTKTTELTASHTYKYPGSYNLTLVVTDSANNIFRSSDDKVIEVTNLIPDSIFLSYLSATDTQQHYSALSVDPIFLTRYNSKSMSQLLSSNNFKVDLSVEGNRMPFMTEDRYNSNKNFHLEGCSFFANTRGKDFKVIDGVETNSTNIFAGISGSEIIIKPDKPDDISNTFVGTSGFGTFYYYEDILEFVYGSDIEVADSRFAATSDESSSFTSGDVIVPRTSAITLGDCISLQTFSNWSSSSIVSYGTTTPVASAAGSASAPGSSFYRHRACIRGIAIQVTSGIIVDSAVTGVTTTGLDLKQLLIDANLITGLADGCYAFSFEFFGWRKTAGGNGWVSADDKYDIYAKFEPSLGYGQFD